MGVPLRISRARIIVYGAALFLIGAWQLVRVTVADPSLADWSFFWSGGATVGSHALLDPRLHFAFEAAHGFEKGIWPYVPAFAWLYVPASHVPPMAGYIFNLFLMLACAAAAGAILADAFSMPRWLGIVLAISWPPVKVAAIGGQNTPLALLLIAIAIFAARSRSWLWLGISLGALLYKPSLAAPFVIVLLARREWRALGVVAVCGIALYLLSVPATAGDWAWPWQYSHAIQGFYMPDFLSNAPNAVSLPGLLVRFGMPASIAMAIAAGLLIACLPRLAKLESVAALSITSALAVALSPHAWHYEPVVMLPAIFYALRTIRQPTITWLVVGCYVIADISLFDIRWFPWNLLIVVVLFLAGLVTLKVPSRRAYGARRILFR